MVTIANGGDNIAVYAPLFASSTPARAAGLAGIFLAMTGVWLCLAWFTVHNPLFGRHLQRWGRRLLPPVLILLGAWILWENGTFAWLAGLVGAGTSEASRARAGLPLPGSSARPRSPRMPPRR